MPIAADIERVDGNTAITAQFLNTIIDKLNETADAANSRGKLFINAYRHTFAQSDFNQKTTGSITINSTTSARRYYIAQKSISIDTLIGDDTVHLQAGKWFAIAAPMTSDPNMNNASLTQDGNGIVLYATRESITNLQGFTVVVVVMGQTE